MFFGNAYCKAFALDKCKTRILFLASILAVESGDCQFVFARRKLRQR